MQLIQTYDPELASKLTTMWDAVLDISSDSGYQDFVSTYAQPAFNDLITKLEAGYSASNQDLKDLTRDCIYIYVGYKSIEAITPPPPVFTPYTPPTPLKDVILSLNNFRSYIMGLPNNYYASGVYTQYEQYMASQNSSGGGEGGGSSTTFEPDMSSIFSNASESLTPESIINFKKSYLSNYVYAPYMSITDKVSFYMTFNPPPVGVATQQVDTSQVVSEMFNDWLTIHNYTEYLNSVNKNPSWEVDPDNPTVQAINELNQKFEEQQNAIQQKQNELKDLQSFKDSSESEIPT